MNVTIKCPFCAQKYELDEFKQGEEVQCAKCGQNFTLEMSLIDTAEQAGKSVRTPPPPVSETKQASAPKPPEPKKPEPPKEAELPMEQPQKENRTVKMTQANNAWGKYIFIVLVVLALFQIAAVTEKTRYTYHIHEVIGKNYDSIEPQKRSFYSSAFDGELPAYGELVAAIPIVETIQKNYGDDKYVTGLRPHTRTEKVILVIKITHKHRFYQSGFWR